MTRLFRLILPLALVAMAMPVAAQTDPVQTARRAAQMLDQAGLALKDAENASDRVEALTKTVQAYEEGLIALREGLRRVSIRENALKLELATRQEEISQLLAVLATMQRDPEALLLLHPSGPLGTVRSSMILGEVTPALQHRADLLAADLQEVVVLRGLQESAADVLRDGLQGVQAARTELSQAISNRTELPRRFEADPDKLRVLLESSDTLEGFASGLTTLDGQEDLPPIAAFEASKGVLPLPVQGRLLRTFNERDAAGIQRPGLLIASRPLALVTAPAPATIRYLGPLLDYGNVIVLEPAGDTLLVLAGLSEVYGEPGMVVPAGAPVGSMGGSEASADEILTAASEGGGSGLSETLYIELRQGNVPVDPAAWFKVAKE